MIYRLKEGRWYINREKKRERERDRERLEYLLGKEPKAITEDALDRQGILSKYYKQPPLKIYHLNG